MKSSRRWSVLTVLVVGACGRGETASVTLDRAEATLPGSFGQVANLIELRDGRVALVDFPEKSFLFGSFEPAKIDTIGVRADTILPSDPAAGKYKLPGQVLRFPGDTIGLVDYAAERTTLWNEKGDFLAVLHLQQVAGPNQPLVYDTTGYAYKPDFRAVMGGLEPGGKVNTDSAPVLRFPREGTIADTVAKLKLPELGEGLFGEATKQVPTIYGGTDIFGVSADGFVWVARASSNSVDWRSPDGKWRRGASRSYQKVPVTQVDKDRFMENVRRQMQQTGGPAGLEIRYPFASNKPPFSTGSSSPEGEVWLLRSRSGDDPVPVYDVIGRDGRLIRTVRLPSGTTLLGIGIKGALYLGTKGADGRQTIGRYRIIKD